MRTVSAASRLWTLSAWGKRLRTPARVSTVPMPSSAMMPSTAQTSTWRTSTGISPNSASSAGASQRTVTTPSRPQPTEADRQM